MSNAPVPLFDPEHSQLRDQIKDLRENHVVELKATIDWYRGAFWVAGVGATFVFSSAVWLMHMALLSPVQRELEALSSQKLDQRVALIENSIDSIKNSIASLDRRIANNVQPAKFAAAVIFSQPVQRQLVVQEVNTQLDSNGVVPSVARTDKRWCQPVTVLVPEFNSRFQFTFVVDNQTDTSVASRIREALAGVDSVPLKEGLQNVDGDVPEFVWVNQSFCPMAFDDSFIQTIRGLGAAGFSSHSALLGEPNWPSLLNRLQQSRDLFTQLPGTFPNDEFQRLDGSTVLPQGEGS